MKTLMRQSTDRDLLKQFQYGDVAAFEEFYARHADGLYFYACQLTGDTTEASDVIQELVAQLCRELPRFVAVENPRLYLFCCARNLVVDRWRREHAQRKALQHAAGLHPVACYPTAEAVDNARRVSQALAALPAPEREVATLHLYENFSFQHIAQLIGAAKSTVADRYHSALERLRRDLRELSD